MRLSTAVAGFVPLAFLTISLLPTVSAVGSLIEALPLLPPCAQPCALPAVRASPCSIADEQCICNNEALAHALEICATAACKPMDFLNSQRVFKEGCGVQVRNKSRELVAYVWSFCGISVLVVLLRLAHKLTPAFSGRPARDPQKLGSMGPGLDDLFISLSLVASIPLYALLVQSVHLEFAPGVDIWTMSHDQITQYGRLVTITEIIYVIAVGLIKTSFLLFFLRIFGGATTRRIFGPVSLRLALLATLAFNAIVAVVILVLILVHCTPISYIWTGWDGEHTGHCSMKASTMAVVHAVVNIVMDFWMLYLPVSQIWSLNMNGWKKLAITAMFLVGTFVTIVSIIRLHVFAKFGATQNPTWDDYDTLIWSLMEMAVGTVCACMPSLRFVFKGVYCHVLHLTGWGQSKPSQPESTGNDVSCDRPGDLKSVPVGRFSSVVEVPLTESKEGDLAQWTTGSTQSSTGGLVIDSLGQSPLEHFSKTEVVTEHTEIARERE